MGNEPAGTRARITVSMTRKFSVKQYESLDLHMGMSDDVAPGETHAAAWKRIEGQVYKEFAGLIRLYEDNKLDIGGD